MHQFFPLAKRIAFTSLFFFMLLLSSAQTVSQKLQNAFQQFENDSQLRHAISSVYIVNGKTGEVIFEKNSRIGLAPASTQKIITAVTAFELLGKDYRYVTRFGYVGRIKENSLQGDLYINPSGDPTLGSWRWQSTKDTLILDRIVTAIKNLHITSYGGVIVDNSGWDEETTPDGWIWQDIGNYYGAGASHFNWRENQYDIVLKSGNQIGSPVSIVQTRPEVTSPQLASLVKAAAKGTGDNSYVYYALDKSTGIIRGTIPVNENAFVISASFPNTVNQFTSIISRSLSSKFKIRQVPNSKHLGDTTILISYSSPPLDSVIYWFLKKSINLYGEALIKTLAYQKTGIGSTDSGVVVVRDFWKQKGLDGEELNIKDGSGLSPQNRVTTHAQVEVLKYAKQQTWFSYFLDALPEFNKMKMKSGTINDVKSFCGYHNSTDGTQYIFSFIVNNYSGTSSAIVQKMYKVLDLLK